MSTEKDKTKGRGKARVSVSKEIKKLEKEVEALGNMDLDSNKLLSLIEGGAVLGLLTLTRIAAGDDTIEGVGAQQMTSASKALLESYLKVGGEEALSKLFIDADRSVEEEETLKENTSDEGKVKNDPTNVVGFALKPFKEGN